MRKRFREYGTGTRKPSTAAERPSLVRCLYCPKNTNVRRDRIEAHTRKVHPDRSMPSFAPLPPAGLPDSPADRTVKATTPANIERAEKSSATKPADRTPGSAKDAAEERHGGHRPFYDYAARQAPSPDDRPPNWEVCAQMGFGELRAYIDKRLDRSAKAMTRAPYGERSAYLSSQAKDRLLDLLGLLARKVLEEGHFYGDLQAATEDERRLRALHLREKELGSALIEAKRGSAGERRSQSSCVRS